MHDIIHDPFEVDLVRKMTEIILEIGR